MSCTECDICEGCGYCDRTAAHYDACTDDHVYTEADMAAAQDSEVALVTAGKVLVPVIGTHLVVDGVVTQVHTVRVGDEADYSVNRCSPGDICGAQDGCNT